MTTYQVAASIRYLDGALAGLIIPSGVNLRYPTLSPARRAVAFFAKVRRDRDCIRATGTGHRYQIVGEVSLIRHERRHHEQHKTL